jgi:rfaE bifunctional protein kinase chain/domain
MADLRQIVKEVFPKQTILIIGDLVADQFLKGTISRVSREAPVFILRHDDTETLPGAAANAAANVAALGGNPLSIGAIGSDASGQSLLAAFRSSGIDASGIVSDPTVSTTTKVRVLAGQHYAARQQVIRIDYENTAPLSDEVKETIRHNLALASTSADAIIVSDYNCGTVFPELYEDARVIARDREIPLVVDSRYRLTDFTGATTATPNREEVEQILGPDFTDQDCVRLKQELGCEALLITNGNEGMTLFEMDKAPLRIAVVGPTEPVDVTGAGDTVIAAYALGLAAGLTFADAARIANHAGGLVVMKKRTATVSAEELLASINEASLASHQSI